MFKPIKTMTEIQEAVFSLKQRHVVIFMKDETVTNALFLLKLVDVFLAVTLTMAELFKSIDKYEYLFNTVFNKVDFSQQK